MQVIRTDPGSLEHHFLEAFPRSFIQAVVQIIAQVYPETFAPEAGKLSRHRLNRVVPHKRWGYIEERLEGLGKRFPDIEIECVTGDGGFRYIEIRSGRFVLTQAYVKEADVFVRPSRYKETLTDEFQLKLFPRDDKEPVGTEYYGIILHGPMKKAWGYDQSNCGFIRVGFPNRGFTAYARPHLNLLALYDLKLDVGVASAKTEEVPDKAKPQIRKDINKPENQ